MKQLISLGLLAIICQAEENSTINFDEIRKYEEQLKNDRDEFEQEKDILRSFTEIDVIELNIGGEIMLTTRETLTSISNSLLSILFNGRWEQKVQRDENEHIFFDFNPVLFRHLLNQLQLSQINYILPPFDPLLVRPFEKMMKKLRIEHLLQTFEKKSITFNVNGQSITSQRTNIISFPNHSKQFDRFLDFHPKLFRHFVRLQRENKSYKVACQKSLFTRKQNYFFKQMLKSWKTFCCKLIISSKIFR